MYKFYAYLLATQLECHCHSIPVPPFVMHNLLLSEYSRVQSSIVCLLKLYVLVYDKLTNNEFMWTKAKFLNRQSYMQDMYGTFKNSGFVPRVLQVNLATFSSSSCVCIKSHS